MISVVGVEWRVEWNSAFLYEIGTSGFVTYVQISKYFVLHIYSWKNKLINWVTKVKH